MPAKSKQQQKFFGVVKAMQAGDLPKSGAAGKVAKDMSKKDVDKYASTKHKGLPKKVKGETITKEQLKEIILQETKNAILVEQVVTEALLNEGWKELALAALMLVAPNIKMAQAQNMIGDDPPTKTELQRYIDQAAQKLADSDDTITFAQAVEMIKQNAEDFEDQYSPKKGLGGKKIIKMDKAESDAQLAKYIKKGYHIEKVDLDTIVKKVEGGGAKIEYDTIRSEFAEDNLFGPGEYQLDSAETAQIEQLFSQLQEQGYKITHVQIKSSTDKQRNSSSTVSKLRADKGKISSSLKSIENKEALTGDINSAETKGAANELLSKLRNSAMYDVVAGLGIPANQIDQVAVWNQGAGEDNAATEQDASERYNTISITAIKIPQPDVDETEPGEVEDIIATYHLVKAGKIKDKKIKISKLKLKSNKGKTNTGKCDTSVCPTPY